METGRRRNANVVTDGLAPAGGISTGDVKGRFGYLLRRAHQTMRRNLEDQLQKSSNITATQHAILTVLDTSGSIDQSTIARTLDLDRMTVGVTVKNLVRARMVNQVQSHKDKRCKLITLTQRAVQQMPEIQKLATFAHEQLVNDRLTAREQTQLARLLKKLADESPVQEDT